MTSETAVLLRPEAARATGLGGMRTVLEYQRANEHLFVSLDALRWFLSQNRVELVQAGALMRVGRQLYIDPEKFDRAVREIGARKASLDR
jgi:hypothetical protein